MNMLSTWVQDVDMTVQMFGPKSSYSFSWHIVNQTRWISIGTDTLYIAIDYNDELFDYDLEMITVTFVDQTKIVSSDNKYEMVDTGFDLYLHGKEKSLVKLIVWALYFYPISYGLFILFFVCLMFVGEKGWIALDFITTLQLIHLIPLARLYYPSTIRRFFEMFEF